MGLHIGADQQAQHAANPVGAGDTSFTNEDLAEQTPEQSKDKKK